MRLTETLVRNIYERRPIENPERYPDAANKLHNVKVGTESVTVEIDIDIEKLLSNKCTIGYAIRGRKNKATMGHGAVVAKVVKTERLEPMANAS